MWCGVVCTFSIYLEEVISAVRRLSACVGAWNLAVARAAGIITAIVTVVVCAVDKIHSSRRALRGAIHFRVDVALADLYATTLRCQRKGSIAGTCIQGLLETQVESYWHTGLLILTYCSTHVGLTTPNNIQSNHQAQYINTSAVPNSA